MTSTYPRCSFMLHQTSRAVRPFTTHTRRLHSSKKSELEHKNQQRDSNIDQILAKPSWSVASLLPSNAEISSTTSISPSQLHHLLRLSALPQPETPEEESEMLKTLETQLHFVRAIQSVDTTGVQPLQAIREETQAGIKANTIGLDSNEIKQYFKDEEIKGRNQRPRRIKTNEVQSKGSNKEKAKYWDVLGTASRTAGKYFVVNSSKN